MEDTEVHDGGLVRLSTSIGSRWARCWPVTITGAASVICAGSPYCPYQKGSQGHESAEPISFDSAGDYVFVAYTRGLKADGVQYAYVKVYTLASAAAVGNLVAEKELGEIGLLDIVQSARAVRRDNGEYVVSSRTTRRPRSSCSAGSRGT